MTKNHGATTKLPKLSYGPWRWYYPVVAYILSIILVSVFSIIFPAGSVFGSAGQVLSYGFAALVTVGIFSIVYKKSQFTYFNLTPNPIKAALVYGGIAGVAHIIIVELLGALFPELKSSVVDELKKMNFSPSNSLGAAMMVITITTLAPVFEELFFRGMLFKALRDGIYTLRPQSLSWSRAVLIISVVISTVAFISVHLDENTSVSSVLLYSVMPLLTIWAYVKSGNLLAPIVAHAINNVFVLTSGLLQFGGVPVWLVALSGMGVVTSAGLAIVIGAAMNRSKDDKTN